MEAEQKANMFTKRVGQALLTAIVVSVAWNVWHYYFNAASVSQKEPWNLAQWWLYDKGLDRAIAADNVGGDTPEGAMQGYIAALEAGDIELAAKYYIPTKQAEVLGELKKSKEKGNVEAYGNLLEKLEFTEYSTSTNSYSFFTKSGEGMTKDRHVVVLNQLTNKWKIAEP